MLIQTLEELEGLPPEDVFQRATLRYVDWLLLTAVKNGQNRQNTLSNPTAWPENTSPRRLSSQYLRNCMVRLRKEGFLREVARASSGACGARTVVLELTDAGERLRALHLAMVQTPLKEGIAKSQAA